MQQTKEKAPCTTAIVQDAKSIKTQANYTLDWFLGQVNYGNRALEKTISIDLERIHKVLTETILDMEEASGADLSKYPRQAQFVYDRMPYYCAVLSLALEAFRSAFDDLSCVFERLRDCTNTMKGGAAK